MRKPTFTELSIWRGDITWEEIVSLRDLRSRFILMCRSGHYEGGVWSYKKIGDWFGLSKDRIRQLEHKVIVSKNYQRNKMTRYPWLKTLRDRYEAI